MSKRDGRRLARLLDTQALVHVSSATPQEVASVLDHYLWRPAAAGRDDRFDGQRFASLIELLMAEGEDVAARVVADLDPSLAIAGLSGFVRVFDPGVLPSGSASHLECEVGGYVVRARTAQAWDAIVGLLVALADDRPESFHGLMRGCRRLSNSTPESDGLDELMLAPEQLTHDVSIAREQRRAQQGYLPSGDARAFLQLARQPPSTDSSSIDAIVASYFRALGDAGPQNGKGLVLRNADEAEDFARNRELAFLANVLVAGCSVYSRAFTAQEAWTAASGICNLGLEVGPARDRVTAFEAGWRRLHEDVSLFITERLIATLAGLGSTDADIARDLYRLRRELERDRDAGTPWRAREALDVIAILDMPTWACLVGLLNECPVLPDALPAILGGRAHSVSATAFTSFTTGSEFRQVHDFADRLGELLAECVPTSQAPRPVAPTAGTPRAPASRRRSSSARKA